jgi:hypothetical protein
VPVIPPGLKARVWRMPDRRQAVVVRHIGAARQGLCPWPEDDMGNTSRLQHDVEIAQRATTGLAVGLVIAAFVLLATAATVYDIGHWLTVW